MSEMVTELEEKKTTLLQGVHHLMELANTLVKVCNKYIKMEMYQSLPKFRKLVIKLLTKLFLTQ